MLGVAAHADTIEYYDLTGGFGGAQSSTLGSPTGSFVIDTTTGVVDSVSLGFTGYSSDAANLIAGPTSVSYGGPEIEISESWYSNSPGENLFADLDILLPVSSLVGYTGGSICSATDPCDFGNSSAVYLHNNAELEAGVMTDPPGPDPTPEPSSILLLGTAMVILAAVLQHFDSRGEPTIAHKLETEP
jgi:hypothetical protein